jgi:hypothetical protein
MSEQEFLEIAKSYYGAIKALKGEASFYEYERKFVEIHQSMGRAILERSLNEVPKNERKKTTV